MRIRKMLGEDRHEVEFSRRETQPKNGRYNDDGYYYEEIASTSTTLIYERSKTPPEEDPPDEEEEELSSFQLPGSNRHLRAREKKVEGEIHRRSYQLDDEDVRTLTTIGREVRRQLKALDMSERSKILKLKRLEERFETVSTWRTQSAIAELRAYAEIFREKRRNDLPVEYVTVALSDEINGVIGGLRGASMKFTPSSWLRQLLALSPPKMPKVGESVEAIEERFDVLARRSGAPPYINLLSHHVHEVDLALLPTQSGVPTERAKVTFNEELDSMSVTLKDDPPTEKVMAIGFDGAINFSGELTVGGGKATRVYGLLLPSGSIDVFGVDMRDQDSPDLPTFRTVIRKGKEEKIFSIRYEESTKKKGQAHLHDDWLLELDDELFISQTEYLRSIAYGVVELTLKSEKWVVRSFTASKDE
jgi:hypothetical protein